VQGKIEKIITNRKKSGWVDGGYRRPGMGFGKIVSLPALRQTDRQIGFQYAKVLVGAVCLNPVP
jgi:hypothetical protein